MKSLIEQHQQLIIIAKYSECFQRASYFPCKWSLILYLFVNGWSLRKCRQRLLDSGCCGRSTGSVANFLLVVKHMGICKFNHLNLKMICWRYWVEGIFRLELEFIGLRSSCSGPIRETSSNTYYYVIFHTVEYHSNQ